MACVNVISLTLGVDAVRVPPPAGDEMLRATPNWKDWIGMSSSWFASKGPVVIPV